MDAIDTSCPARVTDLVKALPTFPDPTIAIRIFSASHLLPAR
jgi:hypothetical protein